jgi:hypothetical protein
MINNFPILTLRRIDFDLHCNEQQSVFMIGILGFTKNYEQNN